MHLICSFLTLTVLSILASTQSTAGPLTPSVYTGIGSTGPLTLPYSTASSNPLGAPLSPAPTTFPSMPVAATTFPPAVLTGTVLPSTAQSISQGPLSTAFQTGGLPSTTGGPLQTTVFGPRPLSSGPIGTNPSNSGPIGTNPSNSGSIGTNPTYSGPIGTNPSNSGAIGPNTPSSGLIGSNPTYSPVRTVSVLPPSGAPVGPSTTPLNEAAMHVQIIFNNLFSKTVPSGTNTAVYQSAFANVLSRATDVRSDRITDIVSVAQPGTDAFVLRFTIQPSASTVNCTSANPCGGSVKQAVLYLRTAIEQDAGLQFSNVVVNQLLNVTYQNNATIIVWTDYGLCPNKTCSGSTPVCNVTVNATYYCTQFAQTSSSPQLLYLLFLLLLIPIIIIIVVTACVISDARKKKAADEKNRGKRMVRSDMLSYHEYTVREKELQPKINATIASRSTINVDSMNTLCRSLGTNLSIAYNGATFITDAGGTEPAENAFNSEMDNSSGVAILPVNDD